MINDRSDRTPHPSRFSNGGKDESVILSGGLIAAKNLL
jgi:hypothetical protein